MQRIWEPPELVLVVGDRVRVRLSGECRSWIHLQKALLGADCEHGGDGDEGVVERIHDAERDAELIDMAGAEGHVYFVTFPPEAWSDYDGRCGSSFARAELERIG